MTDADKYPPMADHASTIAKDWADSLLQNCSKERMQYLAKEYKLPVHQA